MQVLLLLILLICGIRILIWPISFRAHRLTIDRYVKITKNYLLPIKKSNDELSLINFLIALRNEISAGLPTRVAFENALNYQDAGLMKIARANIKSGQGMIDSLNEESKTNTSFQLKKLITVIDISEQTGAPMVPSLDTLIASCISDHEQKALLSSELSSTKSTIVVLALLPLIGIALSLVMGVNSLAWLFTHPFGWMCLLVSASLEALGFFWVRTLINRALREVL